MDRIAAHVKDTVNDKYLSLFASWFVLLMWSSTQSLYSSFPAASFSFSAFSLKYSSLIAYIFVVKGPSNIIAKTYMMQTSTERTNPTGFPNQNDVPKNDIADPTYIGLFRT